MSQVATYRSVPARLRRAADRALERRAMPSSVGAGARVDMAQAGALGATAFSPLQLTGPIFWYDYGNAGTLWTDSSRTTLAGDLIGVGGQDDATGNGRFIQQPTGTARPTRDASFNPSVTNFDGGDRLIAVTTFAAVVQPFSFLVVGGNAVNLSTWYDCGAGATRVLAQRSASSTSVSINAGAALTVTTIDTAARRAWIFEYNGANSKVWAYDSGSQTFVQQGATGNAGTNSLNDARIGGNSANFLQTAEMCEIFAWAAVASAGDRTNLALYVKNKWNPA